MCERKKFNIDGSGKGKRCTPGFFITVFIKYLYAAIQLKNKIYTSTHNISLMMTMHSSSLDKMTHDIKTSKKRSLMVYDKKKIFKRKHLTFGCNFFNIKSHNKRFAEKFQL